MSDVAPPRRAADDRDGYYRPLSEVVEKLERDMQDTARRGDMQDLAQTVSARLDKIESKLDGRINDHDVALATHNQRIDVLEAASHRRAQYVGLWITSGTALLATLLGFLLPLLHH